MKHSLQLLKMFLVAIIFLPLNSYAQFMTGADLDINNVRARINNEFSLFWNPNDNSSGIYEVPKGSGAHTIYAGSMWIGGLDPGGNLHMTQQTYKQSGEVTYWPGPLDTINATSANPMIWDKIWKINKSDILNHIANWNTSGYIIPASITDWPGNSPSGSNYNPVLAPFFDSNGNHIYEPALGEFPVIKGDQAIYFICNDNYLPTGINTPSMGLEIHGMAYAFNAPWDAAINNTVFFNCQIKNYSGINYHDVYAGMWIDFDVQNAANDLLGTDVARNMAYAYNGTPETYGYESAQGIKYLSPLITNSMTFNNINGVPNGNPAIGEHFYNYLKSNWRDSLPLTFGGDGRGNGPGATAVPSSFVFPGTTDPAFPGQDWNSVGGGVLPNDIRSVTSTGPFDLPAGGHLTFELAYITGFASGSTSAVNALRTAADTIDSLYRNGGLTAVDEIKINSENKIHFSPSLVDNQTNISFDKIINGIYSADIISTEGKTVQSFRNLRDNSTLNLSQLAAGIYIVKITSADVVMTGKIVKK